MAVKTTGSPSGGTSSQFLGYGTQMPASQQLLMSAQTGWAQRDLLEAQARIAQKQASGMVPGTMGIGGGGGYGGGGGSFGGMSGMIASAQQRRSAKQASSALSKMIESYNKAFQEARSANEARYQEMLDTIAKTTGQREMDIRASYAGKEADISQQLARLGMSGTTIAPTMSLGVAREREAALDRLADAMQGTKLGIMERKVDRYPDPSIITSLAGSAGQAAGPYGGNIFGALSKLSMG